MLSTVEVKWFYRGAILQDIWEWFFDGKPGAGEQPARVDSYLQISEGDSLGIKIREGRFEVKQRYGPRDILRIGRSSEGWVEQWRKWSFALAEPESPMVATGEESHGWIRIQKKRYLQLYHVAGNRDVIFSENGPPLEQGCAWEIARVNIEEAEEAWWSVGFEAFGREAELQDMMLVVADSILSRANAPALEARHSFGYPRWLLQFGRS